MELGGIGSDAFGLAEATKSRWMRAEPVAEIVVHFENGPCPKTARSEAPGRSILGDLGVLSGKQNPVHPENPVNPVQINSLTDSLTNRYTAIDAAPLAHDTAGNLTRDR